MDFQETYRAYVLTGANAGTMEEVGRKFVEELKKDSEGSAADRLTRAYQRLDNAYRGCGQMRTDLVGIINLECFSLCNDLLRKETK